MYIPTINPTADTPRKITSLSESSFARVVMDRVDWHNNSTEVSDRVSYCTATVMEADLGGGGGYIGYSDID